MNTLARTSRMTAYRVLRTRILTLELEPGQRLNDVALANELGMSRTPVREALYELTHEDLVTLGERSGFAVKDLTISDIQAAFEALHLLTRAVARKVALHAKPEDLLQLAAIAEQVRVAMSNNEPADLAEFNSRFHVAEAKISGNKFFLDGVQRLQTILQRLAYVSFGGTQCVADGLADHHALSDKQHTEIIEHYRSGDADAAEKLAAEHVELFQQRVATLFTRNDTQRIVL